MAFLLGLDLGQAADYSALVLVESQGTVSPTYAVRYLTRWPLQTAYPVIVQAVAGLLADSALVGQSTLIADQTGCGRPVIDMLLQAKLDPIAVSIHGGDKVTQDRGQYRVPKRDLVACIAVLLQQKRLQFARTSMTDTLVQELLHFKVKIDPATAHDSYAAWREQDHDDLVLALALACWWGERQTASRVPAVNLAPALARPDAAAHRCAHAADARAALGQRPR
jgi:hypothetical protein